MRVRPNWTVCHRPLWIWKEGKARKGKTPARIFGRPQAAASAQEHLEATRGIKLIIQTAGGGGWGNAKARDPNR